MGLTKAVFSKNLLVLRSALGLSQGGLADRLNVNASTVSHWESGRSIPDADTIDAICALFNVRPRDLLNEDGVITPTLQKPAITISEALKVINNYEGLLTIKLRRPKKI